MDFNYFYQKTKKEYLNFLTNSPISAIARKIKIENNYKYYFYIHD